MARSGTSMVIGLLQICGLHLGGDLKPPKTDNPKGYFEDLEFLAINREIFRLNNGSGSKPPENVNPLSADLITRMRQFISKWPKDVLVGWKDPKVCITARLWNEIIRPEKLKVVLVSRPYSEIAKSLNKRHGMSEAEARKLCEFYYQKAKSNLMKSEGYEGIEHIYTFYHNYFKSWQRELQIVTKFLGLNIIENTKKIEEFIDINLWHNRRSL
ncbi:unnamed protein product [marine sediment metagenome]|uniref:Sulfotransferase domain-containing protein n=1 Tax=marine sediment metagenome TaxID=412755 RepID=X1GRA0_9ZZZZ